MLKFKHLHNQISRLSHRYSVSKHLTSSLYPSSSSVQACNTPTKNVLFLPSQNLSKLYNSSNQSPSNNHFVWLSHKFNPSRESSLLLSSKLDESKKDSKDKKSSEDGEPPNDGINWLQMMGKVFGLTIMQIFVVILAINSTIPKLEFDQFVDRLLSKGLVQNIYLPIADSNLAMVAYLPEGEVTTRYVNVFANSPSGVITELLQDVYNKNDISVTERIVPRPFSWKHWAPIFTALLITDLMIFTYLRKDIRKLSLKTANQFKNSSMFSGSVSSAPTEPIKESSGITFKDVAGLQAAKQEVMEFVEYLKNPAKFDELGARLPRGALLLGPPGCGKTLLVRALANEAGVPFYLKAGPEFVEMVGGLGAKRMRELFTKARKNCPSIIFIDEIDTIGSKRSGNSGSTGQSETEHTLNQLLVEMDGMQSSSKVIVFAATNRHQVLDNALLRPGRFDRHIMIDFPNLEERRELFHLYLDKYKLGEDPIPMRDRLASLTPGMTGADISNICNEAALQAARLDDTSVVMNHFEIALERVIAGAAKKSRVLSESERRMVAFHEAGHALVGWLVKHSDKLLRVSIVPRTNEALGFAQVSPSERYMLTTDDIQDRMCVLLGGQVAETVVFNRASSGAQDDLKKVTNLAYKQVMEWGMSDSVGHLSFEKTDNTLPFSKQLHCIIDADVKQRVADAHKRTMDIVKENRDMLNIVAEALLKREVLTYDDMVELIGPPITPLTDHNPSTTSPSSSVSD